MRTLVSRKKLMCSAWYLICVARLSAAYTRYHARVVMSLALTTCVRTLSRWALTLFPPCRDEWPWLMFRFGSLCMMSQLWLLKRLCRCLWRWIYVLDKCSVWGSHNSKSQYRGYFMPTTVLIDRLEYAASKYLQSGFLRRSRMTIITSSWYKSAKKFTIRSHFATASLCEWNSGLRTSLLGRRLIVDCNRVLLCDLWLTALFYQ